MNVVFILGLKALRRAYSSLFGKKIHYRIIDGHDEASQMIMDTLQSDVPCMISRFGGTELNQFLNYLSIKEGNKDIIGYIKGDIYDWWWNENIMLQMQNWSGFYPPTVDNLTLFCEQMKADISQLDILGSWVPEERFVQNLLHNVKQISLVSLEPYIATQPWTSVLKNKKVLVIHPFASLIEHQYEKRNVLFKNQDVLPNFELKTICAVQSLGGGTKYKDWFEALNWMKSEIDKQDYDICLIGCGAYGFALAAYVKSKGKKAVHLGGALQLLFGIMGKRWEDPNYAIKWGLDKNFYLNLVNEYWVKPSSELKPPNADSVEDACYW